MKNLKYIQEIYLEIIKVVFILLFNLYKKIVVILKIYSIIINKQTDGKDLYGRKIYKLFKEIGII